MGEIIGILLLIGLVVLVLVLPIRAALRASDALKKAEDAHARCSEMKAAVAALQERIRTLETRAAAAPDEPLRWNPKPAPAEEPRASLPIPDAQLEVAMAKPEESRPAVRPPPLPAAASKPPPAPAAAAAPGLPRPPSINLELFMGAKLFAWIGGLALFLGVVFFVKYAFEKNLIPPALRVATGFVTGAALVAGGVLTNRKRAYVVLGQTLCASGTLILYGVTFAAHTLYRFPAFGMTTTLIVMSVITATAFTLAVRMDAKVVAVLGMAGGFLTPVLVSTGQDNPAGLFGYIALIDIGLVAVAARRRWFFLTALGAVGTILMQGAWFVQFFHRGRYFEGAATWVPAVIFLFFVALFTAGVWWTNRQERNNLFPAGSALGLAAGAMLFASVFLGYESITSRPGLLYGFVFAINAAVLAVVVLQPRLALAQVIVAGATFLHLATWTQERLTDGMLNAALACYLVFGLLHAAFPVLWQRFRSADVLPRLPLAAWTPLLPLVLMLMPVASLPEVSPVIWPAILLVDLLLILLAVATSALAPVLAAIVLTLIAAGIWLFKMPASAACVPPFLLVVGGFSVILAGAGVWLARRFAPAVEGADGSRPPHQPALVMSLPVASAALPFLLLIMAAARLPMAVPTPVFGLGLLLVVMLLGLARFSRQPVLSAAALGCVLALEHAWHAARFDAALSSVPLLWYAGFTLLFTVYPFVFRTAFRDQVIPWAVAAVAGIGHFFLIYDLMKQAHPGSVMGLLPAAFALPPLGGLFVILRTLPAGLTRQAQLAWFGGAALFFVTLIFPIQFERQWLTLGWALEGAALCWLFTRIPHQGLRHAGMALLAAAFVRLALNPAVLTYQVRGETPLLNWHLYAYLTGAAAQLAGAFWLRPPNDRVGTVKARAVLISFAGVLLFLLLNIEIADYFTPAGSRYVSFDFSANFARDMTCSIAWALFALALIVLGLWKRTGGARYAGIGLLAVTLLKLFFHDLSAIGSIYRIAALVVVAVIALAASFLYQRFFDEEGKR